MLCPRCGDEWDATKSFCSSCGFTVRTINPSGSAVNFPTPPQRSNISSGRAPGSSQQSGGMPMLKRQPGNMPTMRQQSGSMPVVRPQSSGLSSQALPNTPRPMHSTPSSPTIPTRLSNSNTNLPAPSTDFTPKPAFEKNVLRKVSSPRDGYTGQAFPQTPPLSTDALSLQSRTQRSSPSQPG